MIVGQAAAEIRRDMSRTVSESEIYRQMCIRTDAEMSESIYELQCSIQHKCVKESRA
jgi:hypothetical protein